MATNFSSFGLVEEENKHTDNKPNTRIFSNKSRLGQIRTGRKLGKWKIGMNVVASKLAETLKMLRLFIKEMLYNITAGEVRMERDL